MYAKLTFKKSKYICALPYRFPSENKKKLSLLEQVSIYHRPLVGLTDFVACAMT